MKKLVFTIIAIMLMAVTSLTQAQSLENVLDKHFKAIGQEKLTAKKSFSIKATVSQMGMDLPMDMKMKKPNKFRMDMEMQGQTMIQAYDGEKGWMIAPWISPEPQELAGDQLKQAIEQANLEGELYKYEEKGHSADLVGKVNLDGKEAYRIKLTAKDGSIKNYYLDADSYMITKVKAKVEAMGQTVEVEQKITEYQEVDGIKLPKKIESVSPMGTATILMEEIKFNVDFDDSIFKQPAK